MKQYRAVPSKRTQEQAAKTGRVINPTGWSNFKFLPETWIGKMNEIHGEGAFVLEEREVPEPAVQEPSPFGGRF